MTAYRMERQIRFAICSAGSNIAIAVGKMAFGLFGASLLMCLYAFCNAGMAAAKLAAVRSHRTYVQKDKDRPNLAEYDEWLCYLHMGLITAGSSLVFLSYNAVVWYLGHAPAYSLNTALLIAAISFVEIGMAIGGIYAAGRAKKPLVTAIKLTNLAFSLFMLALTQTALLAASQEANVSLYNGMMGLVMGIISLSIGLGMALKAWGMLDRKKKAEASDESSSPVLQI